MPKGWANIYWRDKISKTQRENWSKREDRTSSRKGRSVSLLARARMSAGWRKLQKGTREYEEYIKLYVQLHRDSEELARVK